MTIFSILAPAMTGRYHFFGMKNLLGEICSRDVYVYTCYSIQPSSEFLLSLFGNQLELCGEIGILESVLFDEYCQLIYIHREGSGFLRDNIFGVHSFDRVPEEVPYTRVEAGTFERVSTRLNNCRHEESGETRMNCVRCVARIRGMNV